MHTCRSRLKSCKAYTFDKKLACDIQKKDQRDHRSIDRNGWNDVKLSRCVVIVLMMCSSFFSGCLVMGKNKEYQAFDASELDGLVPGQTTAAEVSRIFGAPSQVVKMSNGNTYVYKRSVAKGTALWLLILSFGNYDKQYDQVVFFFDQNDMLTHYGVSLNAGKASYGLPF